MKLTRGATGPQGTGASLNNSKDVHDVMYQFVIPL